MRALSATLQKNGTLYLASLISAERIVPDMVSREHQSAIAERVEHLDTPGLLDRGTAREMLLTLQRRTRRAVAA